MSESQENPLVSVIIPCLNRETLVGEAIESAVNQTYQNLEIIVVNDGSTDGTENVVLSYTKKTTKVRYFKHEVNKGIPAARNNGIQNSLGEYVAFLDSDDTWLPKKIEMQLAIFSQHSEKELGVVWSDAYYTDKLGNTTTSGVKVPDDLASLSAQELLRKLFLGNFVLAGTSMIRRSCFDKLGLLDERIKGGGDDYDLWIRLAPHYKFVYLPNPLAVVQLHEENHYSTERSCRDTLLILTKAITRHPELAALRPMKFSKLYHTLGIYYLERGNLQEARKSLWKAIALHPFHIKALVAWGLACCGPVGRMGLKTYRQASAR
jgi:glycosyltransferase involved in cell wall biosynthesis